MPEIGGTGEILIMMIFHIVEEIVPTLFFNVSLLEASLLLVVEMPVEKEAQFQMLAV